MGQSRKIVVPDGMLKAAGAGSDGVDPCGFYLVGPLRAALEWLAENPVMPTAEWIQDHRSAEHETLTTSTRYSRVIAEWQRQMFLAPDPP